ncbi:restriction endonuclease [Pseudofrancisella aestuarii]|uniref:Restriction endonuclease n=1 Tax=Pseudofrancisella aestuarii TaxID=2670347 RepID=A0ABV9TC61_9GAMM|nr:restriction endonuclease [Pseudofrancisella aestuarii]
MKQISPEILRAMKDALSTIYWYKNSLEDFIKNSIRNTTIIIGIDFSANKREVASLFIDRLNRKIDHYYDDIIHIIEVLSNWTDFSELLAVDKKEQILECKRNIKRLSELTRAFLQKQETHIKSKEYKERHEEKLRAQKYSQEKLDCIYDDFKKLNFEPPQKRGYILEKIIKAVGEHFDLDSKASYKISGEQIDGAFCFDSVDYLLETKFCEKLVDHTSIILFKEKIENKNKLTLGLFISISGFTETAKKTAAQGRNMILMDGYDLVLVLEGRVDYLALLREKKKKSSQEGLAFYPAISILSS